MRFLISSNLGNVPFPHLQYRGMPLLVLSVKCPKKKNSKNGLTFKTNFMVLTIWRCCFLFPLRVEIRLILVFQEAGWRFSKEMGREQTEASVSCANYSELAKDCKDMLEMVHRWGPSEGTQRRQRPLASPGVQWPSTSGGSLASSLGVRDRDVM